MTQHHKRVVLSPEGGFFGYAALFNIRDRAGDIFAPGAFAESLRATGPGGLRLLFEHDPAAIIGVIEAAEEDANGLLIRGRLLPAIARAREIHALIQAGALDGLAVGFRLLRARRDPRGGRHLLAVSLHAISIVTFPVMPPARLLPLGVKGWKDQPRHPKGTSDGGKWTSGGGGGDSGAKPGELPTTHSLVRRLLPPVAGPHGQRTAPDVPTEPEGLLPMDLSRYTQRNIAAYNALAASPDAGTTPVLEMRVRWAGNGDQNSLTVDAPRTVRNEDIPLYCPRAPEVQAAVDRVIARIGPRRADETPWGYGTRAHAALRAEINNINDGHVGVGSLRAELAFKKGPNETRPNAPNLIRTDIIEQRPNNTVCVYDLKTGDEPLTLPRSIEIARYMVAYSSEPQRLLMMEVRPTP
jgi:uncharacterized protein